MAQTRNYTIVDTETSGLFPEEGHEIVQIAGQAINAWDFDEHHSGKFSILIKPEHPELASPDAIKLIKPTWEKALVDGVSPKVAYQKYYEWMVSVNDEKNVFTRPIFVNHNRAFDQRFLKHYLKKYNIIKTDEDLPWAPHIGLDTMEIFFMLFESDGNVRNYKLDTLIQTLGMSRASSNHDAVEDVELTAKAFRRYMLFFREAKKRMAIRNTTNKE